MCYTDWDGRSNSMVGCGGEPNDLILYLFAGLLIYGLLSAAYQELKYFMADRPARKVKPKGGSISEDVSTPLHKEDVCQCHVGEAYINIDNEHSIKGGDLERKGYVVAKKCFVHNSWRSFDGVEDTSKVSKENVSTPKSNLLQLDENISSRLGVKFKEAGIK